MRSAGHRARHAIRTEKLNEQLCRALGEQSSFVRSGVKRIFISRHPDNVPPGNKQEREYRDHTSHDKRAQINGGDKKNNLIFYTSHQDADY